MNRIRRKLDQMHAEGSCLRFALAGCGKMGRTLVLQLKNIPALEAVVILDHTPQKAVQALLDSGISRSHILETDLLGEANQALSQGKYIVTENEDLLTDTDLVEVVVDATGRPPFGARLAERAIEKGKHVVMMNVECDSVIGPILYHKANRAGIVYTGTAGDEPGAIMSLVDFCMASGFEILALGKGKNNPKDIEQTPESLKDQALVKGVSPHMLTSFVDATNTMIELNAVCNATGFVPDVPGCHGVNSDLESMTRYFCLKKEGGILNRYGVVDYVFGVAPGVFAIVTSDIPEIRELMEYLGMGEGPNYLLHRPFHLTSLETPISIFNAGREGEATIAPVCGQVCDTLAFAKRDLFADQVLDGIGSGDVYGVLYDHKEAGCNKGLPIALITEKTRLIRNVPKGSLITYDDVLLDEGESLIRLRREQDAMGL